jgi:peptide deformylase
MNLLRYPDDEVKLRRVAKKVKNPQSPSILMLVQRMKQIAHQWEQETGGRAEGIAAPQIGVNLRVVILRKSDEMIPPRFIIEDFEPECFDDGTVWSRVIINPAWTEWKKTEAYFDPWHVLCNPRYIRGDGMQTNEEGCLSVPGIVGNTVRQQTVIFEYTKLDGRKSGKQVARGFGAAAVCHEIDHLNGHLFLDACLSRREVGTEFLIGEAAEDAHVEEPTEELPEVQEADGWDTVESVLAIPKLPEEETADVEA